jgi:hypothetical protein
MNLSFSDANLERIPAMIDNAVGAAINLGDAQLY